MIKQGIHKGIELLRLTWLLYLIELILALFLGLQFAEAVDQGVGSSMELNKFLKGFEYTVIHDYLRHHGDVIDLILFQIKLVLPIFLVVNVFTTAGIMHCGLHASKQWGDFWDGASKHFVKFFVNFIFYLLFFIIWTLLIGLPSLLIIPYFLEEMACEIWLFRILLGMIILYMIGVVFLVNASMSSKAQIVATGMKPWPAFKSGIRISFRNFFRMGYIFIFFLLAVLFVSWFYHRIFDLVGMGSSLAIIVILILQQGIIFSRILFRMMYIYSIQFVVSPKQID